MAKTKKETPEVIVKPLEKPTFAFVVEDGAEDLPPIQRNIAKTMLVTESFTYYNALKYVMSMEKAVEDKKAEIEGLTVMIKAYRDEIELIEQQLNVTEVERQWNIDKQKRLQEEEAEKLRVAKEAEVAALVNEKPVDEETV